MIDWTSKASFDLWPGAQVEEEDREDCERCHRKGYPYNNILQAISIAYKDCSRSFQVYLHV